MKAFMIRLGFGTPRGPLFAVTATALLGFVAPAHSQTVVHSFSENFDSLNIGDLHTQAGWSVSNDSARRQFSEVRAYGEGNKVFRLLPNEWAAVSVNQSFISEVNTLSLSWTMRAFTESERSEVISETGGGTWTNLAGGAELMAGPERYQNPILSVLIQRNDSTGNQQMLLYSQWDAFEDKYVTVQVPRTGENSFLPSNSITYLFSVTVNLENHSYSFSVSDASDSSVIWTSPAAIAINPNASFPKYLRLRAQGNNAAGAVFDDVVLQQMHVLAPIPEPSSFAILAGAAAMGLVVTRRRR